MTNQKDIFSYLVPGKCAHLAGIGGVSMSPLAEVLHGTSESATLSSAPPPSTTIIPRSPAR